MAQTTTIKSGAVAFPIIALLLAAIFGASYILSTSFGLPGSLAVPPPVRAIGIPLVIVGVAVAGWVFRYRGPETMMTSTYITFMKLLRRVPMAEASGRAEQLVVAGPQRYTRNPLYFGVIVVTFGWALFGASTFVLIGAVLLLLWFRLILIPFEEKELRTLFGEQYARYSNEVPMLVPFTKRKR